MKIATEVLAVLSDLETVGHELRINAQLDRKLYLEVNKVLEAAGGKWSRRAKAHVFKIGAADAVEQVLLTGEITTPQEVGFFPSPPAVVARLLALAVIGPGMEVLEPSAGTGNIAREIAKLGATVDCVEMLEQNVKVLRDLPGLSIVKQADFLTLQPQPRYDRVVMNPPFAVPGRAQADIDHVLHALRFVKPGGRLVSVMSAGVTFREDRKARSFRKMLETQVPFARIEPLPDEAFKESGTSVRTVIVTTGG